MIVVRFTNIDWDTSDTDDGVEVTQDEVGLPRTVTLEIEEDEMSDEGIESIGATVLSDKYGWCVNSFNYEIVPE